MSYAATRWAWDVEGLGAAEKFVLVCIADHINKHSGDAWPSLKTISAMTGLGLSTVKRALQVLIARGLIARTKGGGRGYSTHYQVGSLNRPTMGQFAEKKQAHRRPETGPQRALNRPTMGHDHRGSIKNSERERRVRAFALPDGFAPTEESLAWAKQHAPDVNVTAELQTFVLHYQGNGHTRADWQKVFCLWIMRAAKYGKSNSNGGNRQVEAPRAPAPEPDPLPPPATEERKKAISAAADKLCMDLGYRRGA